MNGQEKLEAAKAALSPSELEAVEKAIAESGYPLSDWRLYRTCSRGHRGQWRYRKADQNGRKRTACRGCDLARLERHSKEKSRVVRELALVSRRNLMATIRVSERR